VETRGRGPGEDGTHKVNAETRKGGRKMKKKANKSPLDREEKEKLNERKRGRGKLKPGASPVKEKKNGRDLSNPSFGLEESTGRAEVPRK